MYFVIIVTWNIYSYSYVEHVYRKKYISITMTSLLKPVVDIIIFFFRNVKWNQSYLFKFCSSSRRFRYWCTQVYTELIAQIRFSKLLSLLVISVEHVLLSLLYYNFKESKQHIIFLPAVLSTLSLHKYRIFRFFFNF